jgi:hypothetical protein
MFVLIPIHTVGECQSGQGGSIPSGDVVSHPPRSRVLQSGSAIKPLPLFIALSTEGLARSHRNMVIGCAHSLLLYSLEPSRMRDCAACYRATWWRRPSLSPLPCIVNLPPNFSVKRGGEGSASMSLSVARRCRGGEAAPPRPSSIATQRVGQAAQLVQVALLGGQLDQLVGRCHVRLSARARRTERSDSVKVRNLPLVLPKPDRPDCAQCQSRGPAGHETNVAAYEEWMKVRTFPSCRDERLAVTGHAAGRSCRCLGMRRSCAAGYGWCRVRLVWRGPAGGGARPR